MTGRDYSVLLKKSPRKAHKALFDEYCNYVYTIVYNKLNSFSREDTEECVSDIFAEIFLDYDSESMYQGDMKAYIGTVAKRRAIDKYRSLSPKISRTVYIEDQNFSEVSDGTDIAENTENSEIQKILLDKIDELGEPDSTIIIQKFYYNRTSDDIAKQLSMKASAVRMRCTRAVKRLKKLLADADITV